MYAGTQGFCFYVKTMSALTIDLSYPYKGIRKGPQRVACWSLQVTVRNMSNLTAPKNEAKTSPKRPGHKLWFLHVSQSIWDQTRGRSSEWRLPICCRASSVNPRKNPNLPWLEKSLWAWKLIKMSWNVNVSAFWASVVKMCYKI